MKNKRNSAAFTLIELLIIILIVGSIGAIVLMPYFESKAYNRLTGAETTYWDAVVLQLRVEGSTQTK